MSGAQSTPDHTPGVHLERVDGRAVLTVDGHDISRHCISVTIHCDAKGQPHVIVDLAAPRLTVDLDEAHIDIPSDVHAALTAAGWAPPTGTGA